MGGRLVEIARGPLGGDRRGVDLGVEALDGERGRLRGQPVEVVLADRAAQRALGQRDAVRFVAFAAQEDLEVVTRLDADVVRGELRDGAVHLHVHEVAADGEDEVVARVHAPADAVGERRVDARVTVHVVAVGSAPLEQQVVLALEHRVAGIVVTDRPPQPAGGLQCEVAEPVGLVELTLGEVGLGDARAGVGERPGEFLPAGQVAAHFTASSGTAKRAWYLANLARSASRSRRRSANEYSWTPCLSFGRDAR